MVHVTWKSIVIVQNPLIFLFFRTYIGKIYIVTETFLALFPKEKEKKKKRRKKH